MRTGFWMATTFALTLAFLSGCGQSAPVPAPPVKQVDAHDDHDHGDHDHDEHTDTASIEKDSHDHSGWWCNEHGVPEEVCALCNSKVAAEFQKQGDWCKEHDRPDSQCFICHPELEAKFAAQYEAKYGKQPPKPEG